MPPALVLLHGFTHTGASWDPVIAGLGERYRSLAPDIRGHGASSEIAPVTLEAVLGDVSRLESSSFTLVGYSMGGRIALHVALVLSDRIDRLVLVGAGPGISDPAEADARRRADARLAERIERSSIEAFARHWATTPVLGEQPPEVADAAHADRLRSTPAGLARALRGLGTGALPSLWNRLAELTMPITLVAGERDRRFAGIAEQMARKLPQSHTVIVPGVGHAAHLEAPERIAAIILGSG